MPEILCWETASMVSMRGNRTPRGSCQEVFSYRCSCSRLILRTVLNKNKQLEALSLQVKSSSITILSFFEGP